MNILILYKQLQRTAIIEFFLLSHTNNFLLRETSTRNLCWNLLYNIKSKASLSYTPTIFKQEDIYMRNLCWNTLYNTKIEACLVQTPTIFKREKHLQKIFVRIYYTI